MARAIGVSQGMLLAVSALDDLVLQTRRQFDHVALESIRCEKLYAGIIGHGDEAEGERDEGNAHKYLDESFQKSNSKSFSLAWHTGSTGYSCVR